MKSLSAEELRNLYFKFFESKGHTLIPSASLVPENDPTVLFTMAGMHPLVPFLLGETHPGGKRLVNVQKCIRTGDIDCVGDPWHLTFFEMLGNWSLGDYFKDDAIAYSFEFLTGSDYLNIPKDKLYFTCFLGDEDFPKDEEAYDAWIKQGVDSSHIFYLGRSENFWILGSGIGPCGPDTEMFYDTGKDKCSEECNPSCSCGKYVEIWNDVFMQYKKDEAGNVTKLDQVNVDTGMGLERTLAVFNKLASNYDSELFINAKRKLEELSGLKYEDNLQSFRIVLDHLRSATFILGDDNKIVPTNVGQGYVLRRLVRRAIRHLRKLNAHDGALVEIAKVFVLDYKSVYTELGRNEATIIDELSKEEVKFGKTLKDGEKHFHKVVKGLSGSVISGSEAFKLFDTFGYPLEMTEELASEQGLTVDSEGFLTAFKEHQEKSKTIDAGSFKGGLADDSYDSTKYHTLAHLMLAALQQMYGPNIVQRGANITSERIRFDFNLDYKMEDTEKATLEQLVNDKINEAIPVIMEEMSYEDAKIAGAHGTFEDKYGSVVKVYSIGDFSKEICGGPHVSNTNELGKFKITKEESSSAGVRRIKAILED